MNADRLTFRFVSAFIFILAGLTLTACASTATPTFFRPPNDITPIASSVPQPVVASPIVLPTQTLTLVPLQITETPTCTNGLTFLNDLTYPDGTVVLPSSSIDKQWLVQNSGTCDWDQNYRLRFVGGDKLNAPDEIPLYPARPGARVTLEVTFTAPTDSGSYQSAWQAVAPDGTAFGDVVYVLITVAAY